MPNLLHLQFSDARPIVENDELRWPKDNSRSVFSLMANRLSDTDKTCSRNVAAPMHVRASETTCAPHTNKLVDCKKDDFFPQALISNNDRALNSMIESTIPLKNLIMEPVDSFKDNVISCPPGYETSTEELRVSATRIAPCSVINSCMSDELHSSSQSDEHELGNKRMVEMATETTRNGEKPELLNSHTFDEMPSNSSRSNFFQISNRLHNTAQTCSKNVVAPMRVCGSETVTSPHTDHQVDYSWDDLHFQASKANINKANTLIYENTFRPRNMNTEEVDATKYDLIPYPPQYKFATEELHVDATKIVPNRVINSRMSDELHSRSHRDDEELGILHTRMIDLSSERELFDNPPFSVRPIIGRKRKASKLCYRVRFASPEVTSCRFIESLPLDPTPNTQEDYEIKTEEPSRVFKAVPTKANGIMMKSQQMHKPDESYPNHQLKFERFSDKEDILLSNQTKPVTKMQPVVMASDQSKFDNLPKFKEGSHQTLASHVSQLESNICVSDQKQLSNMASNEYKYALNLLESNGADCSQNIPLFRIKLLDKFSNAKKHFFSTISGRIRQSYAPYSDQQKLQDLFRNESNFSSPLDSNNLMMSVCNKLEYQLKELQFNVPNKINNFGSKLISDLMQIKPNTSACDQDKFEKKSDDENDASSALARDVLKHESIGLESKLRRLENLSKEIDDFFSRLAKEIIHPDSNSLVSEQQNVNKVLVCETDVSSNLARSLPKGVLPFSLSKRRKLEKLPSCEDNFSSKQCRNVTKPESNDLESGEKWVEKVTTSKYNFPSALASLVKQQESNTSVSSLKNMEKLANKETAFSSKMAKQVMQIESTGLVSVQRKLKVLPYKETNFPSNLVKEVIQLEPAVRVSDREKSQMLPSHDEAFSSKLFKQVIELESTVDVAEQDKLEKRPSHDEALSSKLVKHVMDFESTVDVADQDKLEKLPSKDEVISSKLVKHVMELESTGDVADQDKLEKLPSNDEVSFF
ncbi:hypothetical protein EB796_005256 [Bugula neritina]|uniref:Uncharacterized protein n=1 Tax=Bugula neritina TaxID=10212 RepID=A0A7J7KCS1_BUGNE|nr:hypothetical protein EB796_005256 [Bugula neritina]